MGRPKLAAGGVDPPVLSMYKQGVIPQPRFALYLLRDSSSSKAGAGGEMALGGYNPQRAAEGDITWWVTQQCLEAHFSNIQRQI